MLIRTQRIGKSHQRSEIYNVVRSNLTFQIRPNQSLNVKTLKNFLRHLWPQKLHLRLPLLADGKIQTNKSEFSDYNQTTSVSEVMFTDCHTATDIFLTFVKDVNDAVHQTNVYSTENTRASNQKHNHGLNIMTTEMLH
ncbi:uncharacterized protein LOC142319363 [Lycorma delicatula]|uniref:uncharacterized protein LOC142319363 n=1 Tax=Lycorma delicatula TaxID=130591 RepID=UPI003F516FC5